jgi:Yip1 domain
MDLVSRAQNILMKPKDEWVKIKAESTPIPPLFMSYAAILALIPAVAQFIGYGLIGQRIPFIGMVRSGIGSALFRAIISYVLGLASVYVFGLVINMLATSFGSKQNQENAMKLAVYSMTAMWIGGIFYIFLPLAILAMLAGLYGLYVLYLGFDGGLMDTPKDKVVGYCVVSIVVYIVLYVVVSIILGSVFAFGAVTTGL